MIENFATLLTEAVQMHGHLCPGQVVGVRMSMLGLRLVGIHDPKGVDRKKIYVVVEIDRCATDAIQSVTGCSLGKRTLRWLDHGIMAATFLNLETGRAVRIVGREESREAAMQYFPHIPDKHTRQLEAYKIMPDAELFQVQTVTVHLPAENMPGKPRRRVQCDICREWVQDNRDLVCDDRTVCRNCSGERYYSIVQAPGL